MSSLPTAPEGTDSVSRAPGGTTPTTRVWPSSSAEEQLAGRPPPALVDAAADHGRERGPVRHRQGGGHPLPAPAEHPHPVVNSERGLTHRHALVEPDARERARPVRRAPRGNGPAARLAPRPGRTPTASGSTARSADAPTSSASPDRDARIRLVGAVLAEKHDEGLKAAATSASTSSPAAASARSTTALPTTERR
jgi:hypothetical protein